MNKKLLIVAGTVMATTGIYSATLTAAELTTATADVIVLEPLTLTQTAGMDFGIVSAVTGTASTVVLNTTNGTAPTNGALAAGTPVSGAFDVTGDDANIYQITLPVSTTLTGGSGPDIFVDQFTDSKGGTSLTPVTSSTSIGADDFTVGARLNLIDGHGGGTYSGNYTISVDYN